MRYLLVAVLLTWGLVVAAQNPPAEPRFEVVSIKRSATVLPGPIFAEAPGGGGFNMTSGPMLSVIASAYPTRNRDIVGLPDWVRNERYDVVATTRGKQPRDEVEAMLRVMLAERLAFRGHIEQRDLPVFALSVASPDNKPRPALQRLAVNCGAYVAAIRRGESAPAVLLPDGSKPCGYSMEGGSATVLTSKGITMVALADILGTAAGRIVVDRTGLEGDYAFSLSYTVPRAAATTDDGPTVFTALPEQLGLKLEPARAAIETLVIDHIERPTEN